jgi:hypothetical protein
MGSIGTLRRRTEMLLVRAESSYRVGGLLCLRQTEQAKSLCA